MTHYIEVVRAARDTVGKMLTQRTGASDFKAFVTTNGGRTAAAMRQGSRVTLDLPSLDPDTVLTRAEADRMVAYLVHEVCHMLHTDFAVWAIAVGEGHRIRHWTNALEDIRIEAHEMRVGPYKAMKSLLSGLVTHLYAEAHGTLAAQGKTLGQGMLNAPYVVTILGRLANGYDVPIAKPLSDSLAPNVRKVVEHALASVKFCRSTMDCLELARTLVALEKELKAQEPVQQPQAPKPPQPKPQDGKGEEGQGDDMESDQGDDMREGDDSDQGDDDQGEADDQGGNAGACGEDEGDQGQAEEHEGDQGGHGEADDEAEKGEKSDQGAKGDKQDGDGSGGDDQGDDDQGAIEPDLNLGKTADNILERTGQKGNEHSTPHRLNSMTADRKRARNMHSKTGQDAKNFLDAMTPQNGVLHGQITRLLVSEARTARTHHETSGRLDRRALVRMRTGAPDVFTRRDEAPGVDTAVLLLIDLSGSMGHTIDLARVTAWALANAAESAAGKLAIAGFKGNGADCVLHYVKDWHQNASQAAGALCSVVPNSATPLAASIVAGAQDLADVTATRRILIVLTDGQCDLGGAAVHSACSLAGAMGVEAVGIGMDCETVIRAFPPRYSVNVANLQQLATTGLGTLARMLEEAGGQR